MSEAEASIDQASIGKASVLYLVRHGQAKHNLVDHGADAYGLRRDAELADPELTELGIAQARTASDSFQKQLLDNGDAVDLLVSSTLRRALQTAEIVAPPLASDKVPRIAVELAAEIQFDDIWNEPRDAATVAADWNEWEVKGGIFDTQDGHRLLESADEMVTRCEQLWKQLAVEGGHVIVLVAHSCLFWFLQRRLSLALGEVAPQAEFKNAEIRRCTLPPYDGRALKFDDLCPLLKESDINFWKRHQKLTNEVNNARKNCSPEPCWTSKEWRVVEEIEGPIDED